VRKFNPKYKEAEGALIGEWQRLRADIAGNRDFLAHLPNHGRLWKSLMRAHLGDYEKHEEKLRKVVQSNGLRPS
jgi:type I restriction enzyme R subunit